MGANRDGPFLHNGLSMKHDKGYPKSKKHKEEYFCHIGHTWKRTYIMGDNNVASHTK